MDSSAIHAQPLLDWLAHTTWQAGVLVCLILLVQRAFGRRIGARGRHCLWFLLLIRMALPWAPHSYLSVHNLLPSSVPVRQALLGTSPTDTAGTVDSPADTGLGTGAVTRLQAQARPWLEARMTILLLLVWLAGAGCLAGCIVVGHIRLGRVVRGGRPVTDRWILGVLEECRSLIGTQAAVEVIATDEVPCPALCGWVRLRLLMPTETLAERDRHGLRHIFLHELAHLKRHDILVGHVTSLLHVLHWFNPLIALGLRRMRSDRELACDEKVLSVLAPEEAAAYGRTIVHQIEQLLLSRPRWAVAGLCGDKTRIRERIAMISLFRRETCRWTPEAIILMVCLACIGLTEGLAADPAASYGPGRVLPTSHQDKHANIIRVHIRHNDTGKYLVADGENVICDADEPGEAGLWEVRFDEVSNTAESDVYLYSVAAGKYLTSDEEGNLAVDAHEPTEAAAWGTYPRPQGVWLISHYYKDGYLRLNDGGRVEAGSWGRDASSYWDVRFVWRIKISDDPKANPQWYREHVPGPD